MSSCRNTNIDPFICKWLHDIGAENPHESLTEENYSPLGNERKFDGINGGQITRQVFGISPRDSLKISWNGNLVKN